MRSMGFTFAMSLATLLLGAGSTHATTIQNFDDPGTPYTLTQYFNAPGGTVLAGGPDGNFLRLATAGGHVVRPAYETGNTIGFELTDPGAHAAILVDFDFRMTRVGSGADGFGFALLNTSAFGTSGAAPWFAEGVGVPGSLPGSLALGFDIFRNFVTGDPNNNYVKLTLGAATLATIADPGIDLASGAFVHAHLEVQPAPGGATVSLVLTPVGGAPVSPLQDFFVAGFAPYEARVAFGARTGLAASAHHDLDNIRVDFVPAPPAAGLVALGLAALGGRRLCSTRRRRPV